MADYDSRVRAYDTTEGNTVRISARRNAPGKPGRGERPYHLAMVRSVLMMTPQYGPGCRDHSGCTGYSGASAACSKNRIAFLRQGNCLANESIPRKPMSRLENFHPRRGWQFGWYERDRRRVRSRTGRRSLQTVEAG